MAEALAPFACATSAGKQEAPRPLEYLADPSYTSYDVQLSVEITPAVSAARHCTQRTRAPTCDAARRGAARRGAARPLRSLRSPRTHTRPRAAWPHAHTSHTIPRAACRPRALRRAAPPPPSSPPPTTAT
eukprot:5524225-Prymnesium_polylepis.1